MRHIPNGSFPFAEMSRLSITACFSSTCRLRISRNRKFAFPYNSRSEQFPSTLPGRCFWRHPPLHFCTYRRSVEKPLRVYRVFPRYSNESGKEWTAFFYKDTDRGINGSGCVHRGLSVKKSGRKTVFVTFFEASLWQCLAVRRARSFPKEPVRVGKREASAAEEEHFPEPV